MGWSTCKNRLRRKEDLPFEELHEQADVEDPSQDEEQAVPQADAGVEGWEVQVVVVTDASDHCGFGRAQQRRAVNHPSQQPLNPPPGGEIEALINLQSTS